MSFHAEPKSYDTLLILSWVTLQEDDFMWMLLAQTSYKNMMSNYEVLCLHVDAVMTMKK